MARPHWASIVNASSLIYRQSCNILMTAMTCDELQGPDSKEELTTLPGVSCCSIQPECQVPLMECFPRSI